jgi:hypothetical protein
MISDPTIPRSQLLEVDCARLGKVLTLFRERYAIVAFLVVCLYAWKRVEVVASTIHCYDCKLNDIFV